MQRDSLLGHIHNEDNLSHETKTLKVILKLIFRKGNRRHSREYAPCIRMSDLRDEFATKTNTLSEEKSKMDNNSGEENTKSDVVNINLDKISPARSKDVRNGKPKRKTIKVKITISEEDDSQEEQIKEDMNDISPDKKLVKDKMCVVEQHKNSSFSVVLKMPKKGERPHCDNTSRKRNVSLNGKNLFNLQDKVVTDMFLNTERNYYLIEDTVKNTVTKCRHEDGHTINNDIFKFLAHERETSKIWNIKLDNEASMKKEVSSQIEIKNDLLSAKRQPKLENEKFQFTPEMKEKTLLTLRNKKGFSHTRKEISIKDASKNLIASERGQTNTSLAKPDGQYSQGYHSNDELSLENNRDSNIIHDIVMEHYQDVINYFTEKRTNRSIYKSVSSMQENNEGAYDTDQPPVSYFYEDVKYNTETNNSLESGLYDMDFSRTANNLESSDNQNEEKVEYDSREFLNAALGEDMMSETTVSQVNLSSPSPLPTSLYTAKYGTEKSVGSSEISTLISTTDNKSGIYSMYSTVKKTKKKKSATSKRGPAVRTLFSSVSSSYNYYESVDEFMIETKSDELTRDISLLQGIISQASNATNICKCNPKLYGTVYHLEAERILLHATYKMDILNSELNKYEYEEVGQRKSNGSITIYSLKFSKISTKIEKKSVTQYYLCIVHSGKTVIASNVTSAGQNGEIIFNNNMQFNFDSLLSEVEIKISIYSVNIRNKWNKVKCFPIERLHSPHRNRAVNEQSTSELSHIQLLGNGRIGMTELSQEDKFRLKDVPIEATVSDTFDANIVVTLRLNNRFSGFLNINSGHTLWNRRWCVLDGFLLKYWSCPSQENEVKPLRILDLQKCITEKVATVERSLCSRPRTFLLELKSEDMLSPERYLLSADSSPEFQEWTRQIDMTLVMLKDWNKLKCQTVLLNN